MRLRHLRLVQFRNHRHTDVDPGPGVTLLVGGNAHGKSSLLEAVRVAATGRSPRAQHDTEMVMVGEDWARVRATVERRGRLEEVDIALRREEAVGSSRAAREIRVNGVPVRRGELFGHLLCVLAAPDDTDVIAGPPILRRRMLDLLLAQISPAYYFTLQRYARALLQRNRLLRMRRGGELDAWDEQMASLGASITIRRRDLVSRMATAAGPIYEALSRGRERLEVMYAPSLHGEDDAAMAAFARETLARRRAEELARGVTLTGPHRDDLLLHLDGLEMKTYASRGQQLTAMLALRLAERRLLWEETGEEPVLLLDDILLTLDEARQAYLLDAVRGAQAVMTVTTLATLPALPPGAVVYRVRGGTVEAEHAHLP